MALYCFHLLENQRRGLEIALTETVRSRRGAFPAISKMVRELRKNPSNQLLDGIRNRISDFDQKPAFVRERIIQETRASNLGENAAQAVSDYFHGQQMVLRAPELLLGAPEYPEKAAEKAYVRWVLDLLKRPGNRKFLAQKAIEWFAKKS